MKKVSVLIPVYNCENYVAEAIESVLSQTYKNIEVIIVDDGSTDNSLGIVKRYESSSVKIFSQSHSGAPRARNFAFQQSTGDYIQYLDADDILAPNKIQSQVHILGNQNYLTFCSHTSDLNEFNKGGYYEQEINKDYLNPVDLFLDIFAGKGNIITLCWLSPRNLIANAEPWDERLIKAQDGEFFVRIALRCDRVLFCGDTTAYYRPTQTGRITTNQSTVALESVILSTESLQKSILKYEDSLRTRQGLAYLYSSIFCSYYSKQNAYQLKRIETKITSLQGSLTFVGNSYFGLLSKIVGVKTTLGLKRITKKILQ